ncbi:MAG: FlxA-like family protein [Chlamydiota bacterium]
MLQLNIFAYFSVTTLEVYMSNAAAATAAQQSILGSCYDGGAYAVTSLMDAGSWLASTIYSVGAGAFSAIGSAFTWSAGKIVAVYVAYPKISILIGLVGGGMALLGIIRHCGSGTSKADEIARLQNLLDESNENIAKHMRNFGMIKRMCQGNERGFTQALLDKEKSLVKNKKKIQENLEKLEKEIRNLPALTDQDDESAKEARDKKVNEIQQRIDTLNAEIVTRDKEIKKVRAEKRIFGQILTMEGGDDGKVPESVIAPQTT